MADTPIVVTAANVIPGTGAQVDSGIAGEAITAGQVVYKKALDGRFYKADAGADAVAASSGECDNVYGMALNGAPAAGQPLSVQKAGLITCGGTVACGLMYCLSATAGGFCVNSGLVATDWVTNLGPAMSTTELYLDIFATNRQIA